MAKLNSRRKTDVFDVLSFVWCLMSVKKTKRERRNRFEQLLIKSQLNICTPMPRVTFSRILKIEWFGKTRSSSVYSVKQLYDLLIIVTSPVVSMQRGCRDLLVSRRENLTEARVFYPWSSSDANISPDLFSLTNCSLDGPDGPFCHMFRMELKGMYIQV